MPDGHLVVNSGARAALVTGHGAATSAAIVPSVTEAAVAAAFCDRPAADSADVDSDGATAAWQGLEGRRQLVPRGGGSQRRWRGRRRRRDRRQQTCSCCRRPNSARRYGMSRLRSNLRSRGEGTADGGQGVLESAARTGAPGIRPVTGQDVGGRHGAATSAAAVPGVTEAAVAAGLFEIPAAHRASAASDGDCAGPAEAGPCRTDRAEVDRDCSARPAKMAPFAWWRQSQGESCCFESDVEERFERARK